MSIRAQAEDAVIAALADLRKSAGGYLQALEPYQGTLEPGSDDADVAATLLGRRPAILVTTGDGEYKNASVSRRIADHQFDIVLLVISGNLRSRVARARGDGFAADPGIYEIIEQVRDRLMGVEFGVDGLGFAVPSSERFVLRTPDLTVCALSYAISADAQAREPIADDYVAIRVEVNDDDEHAADPIVQATKDLETTP